MAPTKSSSDATNMHNAIIKIHLNTLKLRDTSSRYSISPRCVQRPLHAPRVHEYFCSKHIITKQIKNNNCLQIYHLETKFTQAPPNTVITLNGESENIHSLRPKEESHTDILRKLMEQPSHIYFCSLRSLSAS